VVSASSATAASTSGKRARSRNASTKAVVYALAGFTLLIPGVSLFFYLAEHGHDDQVQNIGSAFRWTALTLLEDQAPFDAKTRTGTMLTYFVLVGGLVFIAIATASLASKLVAVLLRDDVRKVRSKMHDHIVICGWNGKGPDIVRQLRLQHIGRPIVVLAPIDGHPIDSGDVTFVKGHPTNETDLLRAGIDRAETAIIVADDSNPADDPNDIDARTLLTTLAVESIRPEVYSCVEVLRAQNRNHFLRANADELIVSDEMTGALMADSAITHGLSDVVEDLLTHSAGSEFREVEPPRALVGSTFADAITELKRTTDCLLFAVGRAGQPYDINPDATTVIRDDHRLLVIAPGRNSSLDRR
jgi:voltage-gated potassium channel